jgi:ATP-dependent RNA helicase DHX33
MQRTGRAGREVCPFCVVLFQLTQLAQSGGLCFRLYTEDAFKALPPTTEPEILRVGLALPLLQLLAINQDMAKLELMDKPDEETRT